MTIYNGILMWNPFASQSQEINKGKNHAEYYWDEELDEHVKLLDCSL